MLTPDDKFNDPYAPPEEPCTVRCLHCGEAYDSRAIEWRLLDAEAIGGLPPVEGAWCCPTPGCVAVGYGFDILPADLIDDDESDLDDALDAIPFGDDDDDDEDEDGESDGFPEAIDVFDADAFWLDIDSLTRPRGQVGNTPQPPFDQGEGLRDFAGRDEDGDELPF